MKSMNEMWKYYSLIIASSLIIAGVYGMFDNLIFTDDAVQESNVDGNEDISPDERTSRAVLSPEYLYARSYNDGWLYRINKDGTNKQGVVHMNIPGSQTMPCMTPDGMWVYARSGSTLYRFSTANGGQTTYNLAHSGSGYAIGTDGINLYYGSGSTIYKVTMTGTHVSSSTITMSVSSYYYSVTDGAVWIASGNTWYGWSVNRFTGGNIGGHDITWNYGGIGSTCMNFCFDGERYYVVAGGSSSMPMKVYDSNRNFIRQFTVNIDFRSIMCPYGGLSFAENARMGGREDDDEVICYARYESYLLSVNVSSPKDLNDVSEVTVHLDYNTTNATLCYNWTRQHFYKLLDPEGHVRLFADECTVTNDGQRRWWVNFTIMFNFTFPHREMVDCFVNTSSASREFHLNRFPYLFRVVKDLEFTGTPDFTAEEQGRLSERNWIRGDENMTVTNLTVAYFDSFDIYPDDDYFDVKLTDSDENTWWDNESSGGDVVLNISSRGITCEEEYRITIENIPGSGACKTNLTYDLRIDADPPQSPSNLLCHADSFKDKETVNTNQPEMYVTWDEVEDNASGLAGYYYSHLDNSGTPEGNLTTEKEVEMISLPEGYAPVYVWCIDNVGNIGNSSASGILVDLTQPVFRNLTPESGSWHNKTDIECSVEILDGNGSGIDGRSVEYAVSMGGALSFDMWMPAWLATSGQSLVPTVKHVFTEGEENFLKWRAKDVSGNGYMESPPVNLKVDITPVKFSSELVQWKEWYDDGGITSKILVSDTGSGVDLDSLQARISVSGPGGFGEWMDIERENITEMGGGEYEISVTFAYGEGKGNYLTFRGTDLVRNPLASSDKFNFKVDTTEAYFADFAPDNETYSGERLVECFVSILDDGSGVDPDSVEYSVSTNGGEGGDFGPWKKPLNVVSGNPTQVLLEVEFKWGRENYISWKADDNVGTGDNISRPYNIWVNSEPTAAISSPTADMEIWSHKTVEFDASPSGDQDGDALSFYWSSNVKENRSLGHGSRFSAHLVPGTHTITVHVSDGHGYNVSEKITVEVLEKGGGGGGGPGGGGGDNGTVGSSSDDISFLLFIIGGALVLVVLVLVAFFILRKKKKDKEKEGATPPRYPPRGGPYGPPPHPYPQGQYAPGTYQGYGPVPVPGRNAGQGVSPPFPPQPLMLPPGPAPNVGPTYVLPQFSTEQGPQNLELMALPPGPEPTTGGELTPLDDPFSAILGMDFLSITPGTQAGPGETIAEDAVQDAFPPSAPDVQPIPPTPPGQGSTLSINPSPTVPDDPSIMGLDAMFGTLSGAEGESIPGGALPAPPQAEDTQPPGPTEITMQCHACGNNYRAEITVLPAVVTCSVCQTQGVINSL